MCLIQVKYQIKTTSRRVGNFGKCTTTLCTFTRVLEAVGISAASTASASALPLPIVIILLVAIPPIKLEVPNRFQNPGNHPPMKLHIVPDAKPCFSNWQIRLPLFSFFFSHTFPIYNFFVKPQRYQHKSMLEQISFGYLFDSAFSHQFMKSNFSLFHFFHYFNFKFS